MEQIGNERAFFEVFPTLQVDDTLRRLFEGVGVIKITTNSSRDFLHVHILGTHLIQKEEVWRMEQKIKQQLFGRMAVDVRIEEKYVLSGQYTPAWLLEEYRESIIKELEEESVLAANMFSRADIQFSGENVLYIELLDTIVTEGRKKCIVERLDKIFRRFQMEVEIHVRYRKREGENRRNYDEERIRKEIDAIFERSKAGREEPAAEVQKEKGQREKKIKKSPFNISKRAMGSRKNAPGLIFGWDFDDEPRKIETIENEIGIVTIWGKVISLEMKDTKGQNKILLFNITDFTDTIKVKIFFDPEKNKEVPEQIKEGVFLKVKGMAILDNYIKELVIESVKGIKKAEDFRQKREDLSPVKRVELHCHTKMSDMDGISDVDALLKRTHDWGHPAMAITDHGVTQSFPLADHYIKKLDKSDAFKAIYGVEGYIVDDLEEIAVGAGSESFHDTFVVFDLETTGFSSIKDKIIEIGAVKIEQGQIVDRFSTFVNPGRPIPFANTQLTGITDDMVAGYPGIDTILPQFLEFVKGAVLVAHNAGFDVGFIEQNCRYQDIEPRFVYVDTVQLARVLMPSLSKYKLNVVAKALNISLENHHRAVDDAQATAEIFLKFIKMLEEQNITTLKELNRFGSMNINAIRKLPTYHIILLAKNDIGRYNLYQLISQSHLTYFARRPRIPKSVLSKYREGLIVGSACEAGELFQAILNKKPPETVAKLAEFYDYYEIQPIDNNRFMLESDKLPEITAEEDLRNLNRRIVELGEQFHKPVVATCDVHFMDPEDEFYRRILMNVRMFPDADNQAPLYLRTTEEMLEEFSYLGAAKAYAVVVENTNKIADMIEKISPINPNKCPPVIENSDQELRQICYTRAHEIYGKELPIQVSSRLERELTSIISNGYAVMYIIAQKLVWKSLEDGYLVGSRGSVGSSFVATMAGITEVNPLSPHYYCGKCQYSDFDSADVKAYAGCCGFDMPDKICPVCGSKLMKDGFDIPFETFLGFKGDKEPDIDLNFSGEYQTKAHKYAEVIFGEGHTFKAGTIGTIADKTACGYVRRYLEDKGIHKRNSEVERISIGCTGVRRTTGQHPGGIVVLPHGHDINEFTPVQHPANDMGTDIITTHYDYHSIDHNLLKLDLLGHDDPTMIRKLEEYITSDALDNEYNASNPFVATKIPLDDREVLSLFHNTSALGISSGDIGGCELGCLGIPEFGTDFAMQMVKEANPQSLLDLIRIAGLAHGTNVWAGNAQELIKSGTATISTAICTRDDIMTYLISQGVDSALSFKIMESVRKGKGLQPEWEEEMRKHHVPDWYIWSCKKIQYMFPKAHAAAYVMMAYRIAYCKINYPLAYYAAYFSIRADAFSYTLMCQGKEKLAYHIQEFRNREDPLSNREKDTLKDLRIVQEMYARGFEFAPIDLYRAKADKFLIVDGKLMPSFTSIDGMGEKAAEAVELAAKDGPFLSLDDFRDRTKVSKTVLELMAELKLFGNLPKSNQLSLFDL